MSSGEIERLRNEEGLQLLFGALLGVEANGVERAILFESERMLGVFEVMFGFFNPLMDNLQTFMRLAHTAPCRRALQAE
jgi:hypothetical protein